MKLKILFNLINEENICDREVSANYSIYICVGTINGERIAIDDNDKFKSFIERILYVVSPSICFMHSILDEDNLEVIFKEINKDCLVIKDCEIIVSQSYHNDKIQRSCSFEDCVYYTDPKGEDIYMQASKIKFEYQEIEKSINKVFNPCKDNKRVSNEIGKCFNDLLNELILIFETSEDIKDTEFKIFDQFKISFEPYDEYNSNFTLKTFIGEFILYVYKMMPKSYSKTSENDTSISDKIGKVESFIEKISIDGHISVCITMLDSAINSYDLISIIYCLTFCKQIKLFLSHIPSDLKDIDLNDELNIYNITLITEIFIVDYQNAFDSIIETDDSLNNLKFGAKDIINHLTNSFFDLFRSSGLIHSVCTIKAERIYGINFEKLNQSISDFRRLKLLKTPLRIQWYSNLSDTFYAFHLGLIELRRERKGMDAKK